MKGAIVRLLILFPTYLPLTVCAETYYVSAAGDDLNSGTAQSSPWRSISKVNSVDFAPGDYVLFRGGDTFVGNLVFSAEDQGTPALPLVVGSYGTGRAIISGGTGSAIMFWNLGGFIVQDIIARSNDRLSNTGSGVKIYNDLPGNRKLSFVRVQNVEASGFYYGILLMGNPSDGSKSGFNDVRITDSVAFNNARTGIYSAGFWDIHSLEYAHSNVYIGHCKTYDNPGIPGMTNHSGDGIFLEDVDGGVIERSIAYNNGTLCDAPVGGAYGIWAAAANNILIQFNVSHHNHSKNGDGGGFDFDGGTTNSIFQYNYSHDNDGSSFLLYNYTRAPKTTGNLICRYNVSQNDAHNLANASIYVGGSMTGPVQIYNNTVYLRKGPEGASRVFFNEGSTNVHVVNNIFVATEGVILVDSKPTTGSFFRGNNYWAQDGNFNIRWGGVLYTSLSSWRTASGQETFGGGATGFSIDPQVWNLGAGPTLSDANDLAGFSAYRLLTGSPLIDAGLDVATMLNISPVARDFYGVTLPQGTRLDVGASEYSATELEPPSRLRTLPY